MQKFVHEQNLKLLCKALSEETDAQKRAVLEGLLAEQQVKLIEAVRADCAIESKRQSA